VKTDDEKFADSSNNRSTGEDTGKDDVVEGCLLVLVVAADLCRAAAAAAVAARAFPVPAHADDHVAFAFAFDVGLDTGCTGTGSTAGTDDGSCCSTVEDNIQYPRLLYLQPTEKGKRLAPVAAVAAEVVVDRDAHFHLPTMIHIRVDSGSGSR